MREIKRNRAGKPIERVKTENDVEPEQSAESEESEISEIMSTSFIKSQERLPNHT